MDISFWTQYNPKITVEHTSKKYYGQYLYKIVVYAPAGRLIHSKGDLTEAFEQRSQLIKTINHGGWWGNRYDRDIANTNIDLLSTLRNVHNDPTSTVKIRIEEPRIQLYAETDTELKSFLNTHFKPEWNTLVEVVSGPRDHEAEKILNSNGIIRKKDIGYQYKIILKDGRYSTEVKAQVLRYLLELGPDEAKVTKSVINMLGQSSHFLWNAYFYANDPNLASFITLINPGMVGNIHKLVVVADK
jgi:hypothetical protein